MRMSQSTRPVGPCPPSRGNKQTRGRAFARPLSYNTKMMRNIIRNAGYFFCPYIPLQSTPVVNIGANKKKHHLIQPQQRPQDEKGPVPVVEPKKPKYRSIDDPWLSF